MHTPDEADRLAKAIEEMVQGRVPENLGDEELQRLLQIAKIRLDAARLAAEAGSETQSAALERLIARLNMFQKQDDNELNSSTTEHDLPGDIAPDYEDPEHVDVKELQEIIDLRRQMSEHAAAVSEAHREAVWQRVQARIQASQSEKRGFFRWPFRRRDQEADNFGASLDRMILGEPIWEASDSRLEELLRVAHMRRAAAITRTGFLDQQARVWARLRPRLMARLSRSRHRPIFQRRVAVPWPKLAAAGATVALVVAALGPIPATGLAHHPVTEFARFLGSHIGVTETSAPPTVPPVTEVIQSNEVSADQASTLLGLPVYEPTFVPSGYNQVSSQYFPRALTADQGGLFVLAYQNSNLTTESPETILIYQERASSNSIVVEQGSAQDIWLSTHIPATHVSGTWRPLGSDLTWGEDDAETILFDLGGLRTAIYTTDSDLPLADLKAIADSLASQVAPPTS